MVALHGFVILVRAFRGHKANPSLLPLLSLTQLLRAWVLWTLGERWNTRGAVASRLEVEFGGPYHWVRHPNYAVVGLELSLLPLAFGLWRLALLASAANAALLFVRIRDEERLLFAVPGYREEFEDKPRFLPRVMTITNR
jgi:methyltransferase